MAAVTSSVSAQAPSVESRFVQAFQSYCIATKVDLEHLKPEAGRPKVGAPSILQGPSIYWEWRGFEFKLENDPHRRLEIQFGKGLSELPRTCTVSVAFADALLVVAALTHDFGAGTSVLEGEGQFKTELTSWTTRVGTTEAVVELRVPPYSGAAGRTLTFLVGGRPRLGTDRSD
jgi:hypothetical protein